ncbi:MAG: radical SAM protein, partial [Sporomusaceae bacterium]|nr:radical SAM protein [Sporomusaceae bacterium]
MGLKNYIIPIFVPHYGCRQQCVFCNQKKITGSSGKVTAAAVAEVIEQRVAEIAPGRHIEVAFYGGSFTALPLETQKELLQAAQDNLQAGKIQAIRLSTRPDALDAKIIQNLIDCGVKTVELGAQSLDDAVLAQAARGHTGAAVVGAVRLLQEAGITCGLQFMPGLPGEDWPSFLTTVRRAVELAPDFARIYPAVVLSGTAMADLYQAGLYEPLTLEAAVARAAYFKLALGQKNIPVIRAGLQATDELNTAGTVLKGPYHPAFGEMVDSYLFYLLLAHFIEESQPRRFNEGILIQHHPQDASKVRGLGRENLKKLKNNYGVAKIFFQPANLSPGNLILQDNTQKYSLLVNLINLI